MAGPESHTMSTELGTTTTRTLHAIIKPHKGVVVKYFAFWYLTKARQVWLNVNEVN